MSGKNKGSLKHVCTHVAWNNEVTIVLLLFLQAKRDLNDPENAIIGAFAGNNIVQTFAIQV